MNLTTKLTLIKFILKTHTLVKNLNLNKTITNQQRTPITPLTQAYQYILIFIVIPFYVIGVLTVKSIQNINNNHKLPCKITLSDTAIVLGVINPNYLITNILHDIIQKLKKYLQILILYITDIFYHKKTITRFIITNIILKDITLNPITKIKKLIHIFIKKPIQSKIINLILIGVVCSCPVPLKTLVASYIIKNVN